MGAAPIGPLERWLPIAWTNGAYQVSDLGNIRRTREMRHGTLPAWGLIRCRPNNHGYLMFNTTLDGRPLNVALHRIVMETFVGPCPEGLQVAHLNGRRDDPRLTNLAYVTAAENNNHKLAHGTTQRGEQNPAAKITADDVRDIRASKAPYPVLSAKYGLTRCHISDIRRGAAWRHIPAAAPASPEEVVA